MKYGITPRQKKLLDYITQYIDEHGYSPSYDEMKDFMFVASRSNIHQFIVRLEKSGHIRRIPGLARNIHLVVNPLNIKNILASEDIKRVEACAINKGMTFSQYVVDAVLNHIEADSQ